MVLDEDGNGGDCHLLKDLRAAQCQLRKWQDVYRFNRAGAMFRPPDIAA
jgi:hypothetical protein